MLSEHHGRWLACAPVLIALIALTDAACSPRSSAIEAMRDGDDALTRVLDRGFDVNALDGSGYAPIHHAAISGDIGQMRAVLAHHPVLDVVNVKGETALFLAAALGNTDCTYLLLAAGADPNVRVPLSRTTPLLEAVMRAPVKTVQLLLEHGADPNAADSWGETALHLLARGPAERADAIVPLLALHSADFERRDLRDYTPLHEAAADGNLSMVRTYVARDLDLSAVSATGVTPLDLAIAMQHVVAADVLYRAGARAVATDDFLPPLHRAAKVDDVEDAVRLLAAGADAWRVFGGRTPIEVARAAGSKGVVQLLERTSLATGGGPR